jgi:hypothetical protein
VAPDQRDGQAQRSEVSAENEAILGSTGSVRLGVGQQNASAHRRFFASAQLTHAHDRYLAPLELDQAFCRQRFKLSRYSLTSGADEGGERSVCGRWIKQPPVAAARDTVCTPQQFRQQPIVRVGCGEFIDPGAVF